MFYIGYSPSFRGLPSRTCALSAVSLSEHLVSCPHLGYLYTQLLVQRPPCVCIITCSTTSRGLGEMAVVGRELSRCHAPYLLATASCCEWQGVCMYGELWYLLLEEIWTASLIQCAMATFKEQRNLSLIHLGLHTDRTPVGRSIMSSMPFITVSGSNLETSGECYEITTITPCSRRN